MNENQLNLLKLIAEELGGDLKLYTLCDKQNEWKKIEIVYGKEKK